MILDNLLTFTGTSNGTSGGITAGPQTDLPTTGTQSSSNIVDLGIINGLPTSANGGGARDIGTGDKPSLKLSLIVTAAITGGTDLTISLQGAPDNGSGAPGSYTTMWTSPTFVEASLVAGAQLANIDIPRPVLGQAMPRYLKLVYVSTGTHSAGALEGQIVIDRDDQVLGAGGVYSGYRAGLTVAN